jgi:SAM-dependent methyltransferase
MSLIEPRCSLYSNTLPEPAPHALGAEDVTDSRRRRAPTAAPSDRHEALAPAFFRQVLGAYDSLVTRAYLRIRFSIIRRMLADLLVNLPHEGTVVNFGSGIGLFDLYGAKARPGVEFIGVDIDAARVAQSQQAARRLGLDKVRFVRGDITRDLPAVTPDVVVALDVLHHIPPDARRRVLDWAAAHLRPSGTLFIKDISTESRWRVRFTKLLDDLMTRGEPVWYVSGETLRNELADRGFTTTSFHLWDYIPFPHIIHIAKRP